MSYARIEAGVVVEYPVDVRQRHPNVSFPWFWAGGFIGDLEYAYVYPSDVPAAPHTHAAVRTTPTMDGGRFVERWELVEVEADVAAARLAEQWQHIREDRNGRLDASDWTQVLDAPLDAAEVTAWRVYRQALRDITEQADPFAITWPEAP